MDSEEFLALKESVDRINRLARRFCIHSGWNVEGADYKFYNSANPRAIQMWELAVIAADEIGEMDANEAVEEYLDELRSRTDPQDAARESRIAADL